MTESTESGGRDGAARASGSGEIVEAASGAGASGSGRAERGDGFGRDGTKSLAQVACDLTLAEKVGYALVALPMLPLIVSLGPFLAAVYCMESDNKKYHRGASRARVPPRLPPRVVPPLFSPSNKRRSRERSWMTVKGRARDATRAARARAPTPAPPAIPARPRTPRTRPHRPSPTRALTRPRPAPPPPRVVQTRPRTSWRSTAASR